ncbi:WXG100-like domain-containing protein, partial [Nocardia sp. NPDC004722]
MNVDFGAYYAVGRAAFGLSDAMQNAFMKETAALQDCGGMAGVDEAGVAWAQTYDKRVDEIILMVSDLGDGLEKLGTAIVQAGYNHYLAEYNSILEPAGPPTAMPPVPAPSCRYYGSPPSAGGPGHGLRDAKDSLIALADQVGIPVPDGDTKDLQTSADAWNRLRDNHTAELASVLKNAASVLQRNDSEDAQAFSQSLLDLQGAVDDILGACGELGQLCIDHKTDLERLRKDILDGILRELAALIATEMAISVATAWITFGVTVLIGGTATAATVARFGIRIAEAVRGWREAKRAREAQVTLRDLSKSRGAVNKARQIERESPAQAAARDRNAMRFNENGDPLPPNRVGTSPGANGRYSEPNGAEWDRVGDAARSKADSLPRPPRDGDPRMASSLEMPDGKIYSGASGRDIDLNKYPQLKELLDSIPPAKRSEFDWQCAEVDSLTQALDDGSCPGAPPASFAIPPPFGP